MKKFVRNYCGVFSLCIGLVLLLSACASPVEAVPGEEVLEASSAPLTVQDLEAVGEFLVGSGRVPEGDLLVSGAGAVAVLPDEVVSVGMDPLAETWSYPAEDITDVGVTPDGSSVVVRYDDSFGPVEVGWLVVLNAVNGDVRESYRELGSGLGEIGALTDESRVRVEDSDVLVSYPLAGADPEWDRELGEVCGSGAPDGVEVLALGARAVSSYSCPEARTVHVEVLGGETGSLVWEASWEGDSAPEVGVSLDKDVPGGPSEPVAKMFADGVTGRTLIMRLDADGYVPDEPDPWSTTPEVSEYIKPPLSDMEQLPEQIIFSDDPRSTNDLMTVRSVHALVAGGQVPFLESDVDDSVKIDGVLVENPAQWVTERPTYVAKLRDEVKSAFS